MTANNKIPSKVTADAIERRIVSTDYYRWPGTTLTLALLTLDNGFASLGQSSCVDPANFDEALGKELARKDAFNQLWKLEGYLLAERRHVAAERDKNDELLSQLTAPAESQFDDYHYEQFIMGPAASVQVAHPTLGPGTFSVRYGLYNLWFKPYSRRAVELACPPDAIPSDAQLRIIRDNLFILGYRYYYSIEQNAWKPCNCQ